MKCDRIRELMSAYIDNEINEVDKVKFDKHIAECPRCKEEYELLRDIVNECSDIDEEELPEDFREELHHKLIQAKESKSQGLSDFLRKNRWRVFSGATAAAVLIFALSISVLNGPKMESPAALDNNRNAEMAAPQYSMAMDPGEEEKGKAGIAALPSVQDVAPTEAPSITSVPENDMLKDNVGIMAQGTAEKQDTSNRGLTFSKAAPEVSKKIIKNGNVALKVKNLKETMDQITTMTNELGGYVDNSYVSDTAETMPEGDAAKENAAKIGSITIKVPAANFDDTFQKVLAMGTIVNQSTDTNDVTKQYIDMESRLNNLKLQEKNYQELLSKAKDVEEMLKVETELNRIRTEIDIMMGDLKRWDDQVEYSTIYINLTEVKEAELEKVDTSSVWHRARQGLIHAVNNIKNGTAWLFVSLISALPYIAILGGGTLLAIVWMKKRKK